MSQLPTSSQQDEHQSGAFYPSLILIGTFALILAIIVGGTSSSTGTDVATATEALSPEVIGVATEVVAPTEVVETSVEMVAVVPTFTGQQISEGQSLFQTTCAACHGSNARGVPNLGKNLIESEFVLNLTDQELLNFIIVGRQPWDEGNTTGIAMPPRGGNPIITDEQLTLLIYYIRDEQMRAGYTPAGYGGDADFHANVAATPTPEVAVAAEVTEIVVGEAPAETEAEVTRVVVHEVVTPEPRPFDAEETYGLFCAGCHGVNGEGTTINGPALIGSDIGDDAEMFAFLTAIQPFHNDGSFVHPSLLTEPALHEADVQALIDYVQGLVE